MLYLVLTASEPGLGTAKEKAKWYILASMHTAYVNISYKLRWRKRISQIIQNHLSLAGQDQPLLRLDIHWWHILALSIAWSHKKQTKHLVAFKIKVFKAASSGQYSESIMERWQKFGKPLLRVFTEGLLHHFFLAKCSWFQASTATWPARKWWGWAHEKRLNSNLKRTISPWGCIPMFTG